MEKKRDSFFMKMKRDTGKPVKKNHEELGENKFKRQEEFNKNRKGLEVNKEKKPFDKKAYRLKKYSKKYKLEQWEEQRKKRLLREYHKEIKNDPTTGTYKAKSFDEDTTDANQEVGKYVRHPDFVEKEITNSVKDISEKENSENVKGKRDPYRKAKEHFNKVKQEKLLKQQEIQRVQEEKKQKLDEYKKKKNDRFKKLSKKTKKGQPVMTGRLELLLEKIQKSK